MFQRDVPPFTSVDDYLAGERGSPIRHEYVDGQVYAMAGASDRHNRIALRLAARLDDVLELRSVGLTLTLKDVYRGTL